MAYYLWEPGDAEAILTDVSLLQMGIQGSARLEAQAQHAASGLALAALTSNVSAKVEAHVANAPLGQVHTQGSAMLEAMAQAQHAASVFALAAAASNALAKVEDGVANAAIGPVRALRAGLENVTDSTGQHTLLYILLAVMLVLLPVIMWLACSSDKDERRPNGQPALPKVPAVRQGRRRPLDQALLADAERSGSRSPAESSTWDVADLPHICLLRMNLDQESSFTVFMNSLNRAEDVAEISGPSGKKFLGASIRPEPGGRSRLAVSLLFAEAPLGSVIAPQEGDSRMEVYDQSGQVYGAIEQTEHEEICIVVVRGRPAMQLERQEDGQKTTWSAVMGSHTLATSTADNVDSAYCGGQRSVCHVQVKPGTNVILLLLCMLALNRFKLSPPGQRQVRELGC